MPTPPAPATTPPELVPTFAPRFAFAHPRSFATLTVFPGPSVSHATPEIFQTAASSPRKLSYPDAPRSVRTSSDRGRNAIRSRFRTKLPPPPARCLQSRLPSSPSTTAAPPATTKPPAPSSPQTPAAAPPPATSSIHLYSRSKPATQFPPNLASNTAVSHTCASDTSAIHSVPSLPSDTLSGKMGHVGSARG